MGETNQLAVRVLTAAGVLLADALLTFLMLVAIFVDSFSRRGFRNLPVSPEEFRDWVIILLCWGLLMAAIAVLALRRGRLEIAALQVVAALVVLILVTPTFRRVHQESRPPTVPPAPVAPYCLHGNCPGG